MPANRGLSRRGKRRAATLSMSSGMLDHPTPRTEPRSRSAAASPSGSAGAVGGEFTSTDASLVQSGLIRRFSSPHRRRVCAASIWAKSADRSGPAVGIVSQIGASASGNGAGTIFGGASSGEFRRGFDGTPDRRERLGGGDKLLGLCGSSACQTVRQRTQRTRRPSAAGLPARHRRMWRSLGRRSAWEPYRRIRSTHDFRPSLAADPLTNWKPRIGPGSPRPPGNVRLPPEWRIRLAERLSAAAASRGLIGGPRDPLRECRLALRARPGGFARPQFPHRQPFVSVPDRALRRRQDSLLRMLFLVAQPTRGLISMFDHDTATLDARTAAQRCAAASASCFRISGCSII